jgi:signal transduction histidine kinase
VTKELVEKNGGRVLVTSATAATDRKVQFRPTGAKTTFRVEFPLTS